MIIKDQSDCNSSLVSAETTSPRLITYVTVSLESITLDKRLEEIESVKDSARMFEAVRELTGMKKKSAIVITDENNNTITHVDQVVKVIAANFYLELNNNSIDTNSNNLDITSTTAKIHQYDSKIHLK